MESSMWFDDEEMNEYAQLLNDRYAQEHSTFVSNSFLFTLAKRNCEIQESFHKKRQCREIRRSARLEELSRWIIPINEDNVHWITAIVFVKEHLIAFYDSLSSEMRIRDADCIRELLITYGGMFQGAEAFRDVPWVTVGIDSFSEVQTDTYNCGVYALVAAEIGSSGSSGIPHAIKIRSLFEERLRIERSMRMHSFQERVYGCVDFSLLTCTPYGGVCIHDPGRYSAATCSMAVKRRRMEAIRDLKQKGRISSFQYRDRYAVGCDLSDAAVISLYEVAEQVAERVPSHGILSLCFRPSVSSGHGSEPFMLERMIVSALVEKRAASSFALCVILPARVPKETGTAPLEDLPHDSNVFRSDEALALNDPMFSMFQSFCGLLSSYSICDSVPPSLLPHLYVTHAKEEDYSRMGCVVRVDDDIVNISETLTLPSF